MQRKGDPIVGKLWKTPVKKKPERGAGKEEIASNQGVFYASKDVMALLQSFDIADPPKKVQFNVSIEQKDAVLQLQTNNKSGKRSSDYGN